MQDRAAMTNDRRQTPLNDALSRLRDRIEVPHIDPERERALLAVFDAHWARPRPRRSRWVWTTAAAALIVVAVGLNWIVVTHPRRSRGETADAVADSAG